MSPEASSKIPSLSRSHNAATMLSGGYEVLTSVVGLPSQEGAAVKSTVKEKELKERRRRKKNEGRRTKNEGRRTKDEGRFLFPGFRWLNLRTDDC